MISSTIEEDTSLPFDLAFFDDQINRVIDTNLPIFSREIKKNVYFHLFFILLGFCEFMLFVFFLSHLVQSSWLAISLAALFLTFFSYYILRLYLQTKQPEYFLRVRDRFIRSCKKLFRFRGEVPEHHLALANACTLYADFLQGKERSYYKFPHWLDFLGSTMERFSLWWHWHDVYYMRELLLQAAVEEHLILVQFEPTDLEVHAGLANAYIRLSSLYSHPVSQDFGEEDRWQPPEKVCEILSGKFRATAERAIEEFKILDDYAPDDPWVHMQLAYSYHDLGMPEEEVQEYEKILRICPDDKDILFKLGMLYFQQGRNAKGLQIFEELKDSNYRKAEQLIGHYGDYAST